MPLSFMSLVCILDNRQRIQNASRNSYFINLNPNQQECNSLNRVIPDVPDLAVLIAVQKLYVQAHVS